MRQRFSKDDFGWKIVGYIILGITVILVLVPVIYAWMNAFKTNEEIAANILSFPRKLHFSNFIKAWNEGNFGKCFTNSLIVSSISVVLVVVLAALASYPLARMQFSGNKLIFLVFLLGMALPATSKIGPLLTLLYSIKMVDTLSGLILVHVAGGMPFSIMMMRTFFRGFPQELEDSAFIDGCNRLQFLTRILVPLSLPSILVLALFIFMGTWNEFFMSLIVINSIERRTLPLGLLAFQGSYYFVDYGLSFAGLNIVALPIVVVYVLLQRNFIQGTVAGALK